MSPRLPLSIAVFLSSLLPLAAFEPEVPEPGTRWEATPPPFPPLAGILARPVADRAIYGVYCWSDEYVRYHDSIKKIGWTNLRLGGPTTDDAIRLTTGDDMEVMLTVSFRMNPGESDADYIARFAAVVEERLERYGSTVAAIEIGNEPNFHYMDGKMKFADKADRLATEAHRAQLYGQLLAAVGERVKARWPEVKVVGFGAGGASSGDIRFLEATHAGQSGLAKFYDILSTHPYVSGAPPEADVLEAWGRYSIAGNYGKIREIMAANGAASKPIRYTELNWEIPHAAGGHYEDKPGNRRIPPDLQAAYLVRAYAVALRLGVERLQYMSLVDTDNCNSGFMNRDGSWRPSAHAMRRMIEVIPRPQLLGALEDGADGRLFAYRYRADFRQPDSAEVLMAWNVTGPRDLEIDWPHAEALVYPMYGEPRRLKSVEGRLKLALSPYPVYVRTSP